MKTSVWGPSAWRFLHAVSFAYPETPTSEQQDAALQLFLSLRHMIPCGDCCGHYCSEIQRSPPRVESREALSRWLVDIHNRVNARLGKPQYPYAAALAEYTAEASQCLLPTEPCSTDRQAPASGPRKTIQSFLVPLLGFAVVGLVVLAFVAGRQLTGRAPIKPPAAEA